MPRLLGLGREDSRVTQVGWKAECTERGQKSLFLESSGLGGPSPAQRGYLFRVASEDWVLSTKCC